MHPDDLMLQKYADRETDAISEARIREHLAACAACRERAALLDAEVSGVDSLLRSLDSPVPRVDLRSVVSAARARRSPVYRRAAVIAFLVGGAGVAWALPGSPLRSWLGVEPDRGDRSPPPVNGAPAQSTADLAGLQVAPGQRLIIVFAAAQTAGTVSVSLSDDAEAFVSGPVGTATFTSNGDRLEIGNRGSQSNFEIHVPRAAPRVEIRVGNRLVLLKEGARITTDVVADGEGRYVIPLNDPGA